MNRACSASDHGVLCDGRCTEEDDDEDDDDAAEPPCGGVLGFLDSKWLARQPKRARKAHTHTRTQRHRLGAIEPLRVLSNLRGALGHAEVLLDALVVLAVLGERITHGPALARQCRRQHRIAHSHESLNQWMALRTLPRLPSIQLPAVVWRSRASFDVSA